MYIYTFWVLISSTISLLLTYVFVIILLSWQLELFKDNTMELVNYAMYDLCSLPHLRHLSQYLCHISIFFYSVFSMCYRFLLKFFKLLFTPNVGLTHNREFKSQMLLPLSHSGTPRCVIILYLPWITLFYLHFVF